MNTITAPAARPEPGEVMREYFQIGKHQGRHLKLPSFLKFSQEFITYIEQGRHIQPGQGEHRATRPNSTYNITEDTTRDQLKAHLMGKRSDWVLRA